MLPSLWEGLGEGLVTSKTELISLCVRHQPAQIPFLIRNFGSFMVCTSRVQKSSMGVGLGNRTITGLAPML
jgi:hypothetical protein